MAAKIPPAPASDNRGASAPGGEAVPETTPPATAPVHEPVPEPVHAPVPAVVWPWRLDTAEARLAEARRRDRAARRGAAVRTLIGLLIATALAFWKPWLAVIVVTIAILTLALALASPRGAYAKLEHGLQRFAHGVGLAVTWLILPILYYLLFFPTGRLMRARRKLRLTFGAEPRRDTYWTRPHAPGSDGRWQGRGLDRYRRQF